jgi:hypothetical protein
MRYARLDELRIEVDARITGDAANASPLTTKGDLYTFSTTQARLPVGASGYYLSADPSTATGLKWVAGSGGGSSDHATLSNLVWTASGHTGTASRVAGFNGSGAATYYVVDSIGGLQGYSTTLAAVVAGTYSGSTGITTLGTITSGTWSGSVIAVDKGGTGLSSYTAGDMLYASGTTTLAATPSSSTGRSILNLSAPPVGYTLGNSGSGLAWVAMTVYIAQVRIPATTFVIAHDSNPALIVQSTGTIGGP